MCIIISVITFLCQINKTNLVCRIYTVFQKTSPSFISCSLVKHCPIFIILGRNIPQIYRLEVVSFPTSPNLCSCTIWEIKKCKYDPFACYSIVLFGQSKSRITFSPQKMFQHHLRYANDAKTYLKHFSNCLFYFCSTCADSLNASNPNN